MSKKIKVGNIHIGGGERISVQSMTNTDTADYDSTSAQIKQLVNAGCDIVRLAVRDMNDIEICKRYISESTIPLVADIQFDYRLAVASADIGFSKIRFNPGNTSLTGLSEVVSSCKANSCPIRIGINAGSLEKELKSKYGVSPESLTESALKSVNILEKMNFNDIIISVKASDVKLMIDSYKLLASKTDYPLHLGVTESGYGMDGLIKSSIGIGSLLLDGIGDTIRVSLTGDPVLEVKAALSLLNSIGLRNDRAEIVSCPTCARCFYDLEAMVLKCKELLNNCNKKLKIAVMGCVVNGPGEAEDADIGIAGGKEKAVLFSKGKLIETLPVKEAEEKFLSMLSSLIG